MADTRINALARRQIQLLVDIARAGGFAADVTHNRERIALTCVRNGWAVSAGPSSLALTWSGWNALPKMLDADCAEKIGVTAASWNDYAGRGTTPPADGYTEHPKSGRAVRFWWPWTIDAWLEQRGSAKESSRPPARAVGQRQCTWREPGSTGRYGFCKRPVGDDEEHTCSIGHTDADRAA